MVSFTAIVLATVLATASATITTAASTISVTQASRPDELDLLPSIKAIELAIVSHPDRNVKRFLRSVDVVGYKQIDMDFAVNDFAAYANISEATEVCI